MWYTGLYNLYGNLVLTLEIVYGNMVAVIVVCVPFFHGLVDLQGLLVIYGSYPHKILWFKSPKKYH